MPAAPKRVVVVGFTDHEPLLALGIRPVGAMDWFGDGHLRPLAVGARRVEGKPAEIVSTKAGEIDFEKVAAQRPDLILGLYAELKRGEYAKLSKIAPTVAQAPGDAYTTPWRDMTRTAAKAVGRVREGRAAHQAAPRRGSRGSAASTPRPEGPTALVADAGTRRRASTRSPPPIRAGAS